MVAIGVHAGFTQTSKPNFVIIMADDLGTADLGAFGSKTIKTPYLDGLAEEGAKFNSFYVPTSSCSPSRAAMMTGRHSFRSGIYTYLGIGTVSTLGADEITMGKALKDQGYSTGFFGKWGLNNTLDFSVKPLPDDHGFEYYFATQNNAHPNHENPTNFVRNGHVLGEIKGFSAGLVVDEAIKWVQNRENSDQPFLMVVWPHEPHIKLATPDSFKTQYKHLPDTTMEYNANVSHLDYQVGRLLGALDGKYKENTFVLFTSDNGHKEDGGGVSGPFRGSKGDNYEGGIRMPAILRWPGVVNPGTTLDNPLSTLDLFPTVLEIVGAGLPQDRDIDGQSFASLLQGNVFTRTKPIFSLSDIGGSIRDGDWKLIGKSVKFYEDDFEDFRSYFKTRGFHSYELYNLSNDIGEKNNVLSSNRAQGDKMIEQFEALNAVIMEDAPNFPNDNVIPKWDRHRWQPLDTQPENGSIISLRIEDKYLTCDSQMKTLSHTKTFADRVRTSELFRVQNGSGGIYLQCLDGGYIGKKSTNGEVTLENNRQNGMQFTWNHVQIGTVRLENVSASGEFLHRNKNSDGNVISVGGYWNNKFEWLYESEVSATPVRNQKVPQNPWPIYLIGKGFSHSIDIPINQLPEALWIRNVQGKLIRKISMSGRTVYWDKKNQGGVTISPGRYALELRNKKGF